MFNQLPRSPLVSLITHVRASESCHPLFSRFHRMRKKPNNKGAVRSITNQRISAWH